ncbi:MAG TPA: hypothetical protein VFM05_05465 [Candidatus Saccharimonadales bacterium]|nr:hypothetical protein [Candidatus Saccharimonadales bacterium]
MNERLITLYYIIRFRLLRFKYDVWVMLLCRHTRGFESFEQFRYKFRKHARSDFDLKWHWQYLRRADDLWGAVAVAANHLGPPIGLIEQCLREFDAMFIRYDNRVNGISFLHYNRIQTYYRENDREAFLGECLRAEEVIENEAS